MRRFTPNKRDGNHHQLLSEVRGYGYEVIETFKPLDVLVYGPKGAGWMEIKIPGSTARIMTSQIKFMADTKMPVAFVKTASEAVEFAQTLVGLTQKQKDNLALFARDAALKQYHPAVIERVLNW